MSDPTYRIDVEHNPASPVWPWTARVYRVSDDAHMASRVAMRREDVLEEAAAAVQALNAKQPDFSVLVDDDGRPVEGHSVKAAQ